LNRVRPQRLTRHPAIRRGEPGRRRDVAQPDLHLGLQVELLPVVGHLGLRQAGERPSRPRGVRGQAGQAVDPDDHVLGRHGDGLAVGRLQDVVGRQHQDPRLGLRLGGQRDVHGHLVTVEVRVERGADERVNLDGLALDQLRLERLDAQPVQRRRPVEQHRVLGDDLFEDIPDHRLGPLDHALGRLDVLRVVQVDQALHDERLEQLDRHLLGQPALVQLELRADHDDRAARVVDALAEQVLAEPALLALEHVRQRLERPVARPGDRAAAAAVVEQRVHGLLEHPLLVVDDDLGRAEVEQPLEPVVPVDDPAVQVVQVGGGEPAAVELNHGPQVRRDHRDAVQHHAERAVGGVQERRDDLEPLQGAGLALALAGPDDLPQVDRLGIEIEAADPLLDGLGAHAAAEVPAEAVPHLAVEQLVTLQVLDLEAAEAAPDLLDPVDLPLRAVADLLALAVGALPDLAAGVTLRAGCLQLGQVLLELALPRLDVSIAALLQLALLDRDLGLERGQVTGTRVVVDVRDHVRGEVDDLLQVLRRQVQQVAQPARDALEVPDVRDGGGQLDVAHPLAPHLGPSDLDAAALADDALEPNSLVLAAVALPVPGGTEDLLAEEPVLLRLQGAVVDGLRLLDLAMGPQPDVISRGQANPQVVKVVDV
jgi:hypothetical protein